MTATQKRPKNEDRLTPDYDAWLDGLRRRLEPRGAKSALADYIARSCQVDMRGQKSAITAILARRTIPSGQFVCAANAWMRTARITD